MHYPRNRMQDMGKRESTNRNTFTFWRKGLHIQAFLSWREMVAIMETFEHRQQRSFKKKDQPQN